MKKLLYLQSRLRSGGPSNQLSYLIEHLDRSKYDPSVLTLSPEGQKTARPLFQSMGVPVHTLGLGRIEGLIKGGRPLKEFVSTRKPDLIHSQGWRPDLLSAFHIDNIPRVATVRNHAYEDYVMKFGAVRGRIMALTHLQALKHIDKPIGCSRSVANYLKKHGVEAGYVQNGVDINQFNPVGKATRRDLRDQFDLQQDRLVFVSVGHLRKRKDPLTVIKGFLGSDILEHSTLLIIGEGPLRETCEEVAGANPEIKFTGRVDNVHEYLRASDVFVSASLSEGLPNTVMEALATGLPVILSDINPHREIIDHDRRAGFLFEQRNEKEVSSLMNNFTVENVSNFRKFCLEIAKNELDSERMSMQYQKMYNFYL